MNLSLRKMHQNRIGLTLGEGFDFAFTAEDYVIISSAGVWTRIGIGYLDGKEPDNGGAVKRTWTLESDVGNEHFVLFHGSYQDVHSAFEMLKADLQNYRKQSRPVQTGKSLLSFIGGTSIVLCAFFGLVYGLNLLPSRGLIERAPIMEQPNGNERDKSGGQPTPEQLLKFMQLMTKGNPDYRALMPLANGTPATNDGSLQRQLPMSIETTPKAKTPDDLKKSEPPVTLGNALGLPSYSPSLYKDAAPADATREAKPAPAQLPEKAPQINSEAPKAEPTNASASDKVSDAVSTVPNLKDKPQDENAALKNSIKDSLKGMSAEQAADALRKISMLSPEQLKGQSLENLPPEIQALIRNAASAQPMAEKPPTATDQDNTSAKETDKQPEKAASTAPGELSTNENGVPTRLIILPQPVIDQLRTDDGIASIPENQSWQARGNPTVHLPLPGGGDIKTVEDLKKFGFQP